jgi:hypothetical protein
MQTTKRSNNDQRDLQRSRFDRVVDLEHKLANAISAVADYNSRLRIIRPEALFCAFMAVLLLRNPNQGQHRAGAQAASLRMSRGCYALCMNSAARASMRQTNATKCRPAKVEA